MSHAFLSDLALRVSLHPGCRVELRHHWPAPHYHKTAQDVAEEAQEQLRRQAARAAFFSSSSPQLTTAPPLPAAGTSITGSDPTSTTPTTSAASGINSNKPFNPFTLFRVRKKRSEATHARRQSNAHHTTSTSKERPSEPSEESVALAPSTAKAKGIDNSNNKNPSPKLQPTTTQPIASTPHKDKVKLSRSPTTPAVAAHTSKKEHNKKSRSSEAAKTTASSTPFGVPQQYVERVSESGPSPSTPHMKHALSASIDKGAAKVHEGGVQTTTKAHGTTAIPTPTEARKKTRKTNMNGKAGKHNKTGSLSSRSNSSHSNYYRNDHHCRDSDLDSEDLMPCRDPLNIRLPRNPAHYRTGGVPRPLHVTVRWSGVLQRRRRYNRQLKKRQGEQDVAAPPWHVTTTPSTSEMASNEASPTPSETPQQSSSTTMCKLKPSSQRHRKSRSGKENSEAAIAEHDGAYVYDGTHHHHLRSCSSDVKKHGAETSSTHPPAAPATVCGGASTSSSVTTTHSLQPPSTVDVMLVGSNDPTVKVQNPAQQQHYFYARQPACKTATMFSQSTATATAPRTSVLDITNSELPTPSSSVSPYAATSTQSCLRRPNSLLVIRSPPQDSNLENIMVSANGMCYYSSPSVYGRATSNATSTHGGTAGQHGLQADSSSSNLRITYVTNNNISNSAAEGMASSQQQQPRPHGLAHVPRPHALTINAQGFTEMGSCGQIRSSSGSPTNVVVPGSSMTGGGPGPTFANTTPPNSLPSTPLCVSSPQNMATYSSSGNNNSHIHSNPSNVPGLRSAAPNLPTHASQQTPPPLSMKTVLVQRRRSSLLRQQQAQAQRQMQLLTPPFFSFFPPPEAVAASTMYCKSAYPVTAVAAASPDTLPKLHQAQSTASSTADTVAFSPLNVHITDKTNFSSPSPVAPRGPTPVDGIEGSPLPCGSAKHAESRSSCDVNADRSQLTLHEDSMGLGGPPARDYLSMHYPHDLAGLSVSGGGGNALRPTRVSQQYAPPTPDVTASAPYGASSGCFGTGSGQYARNVPYGASVGDDVFIAGANSNVNYAACTPQATQAQNEATFQSLSIPTAMWACTGGTDFHDSTLLHPLKQQQKHQQSPDPPLGPWNYTRSCLYAPSVNSAWVEHARLGATTPTVILTPMMYNTSSYMGNTGNMYSEPATPMLRPQQQQQFQRLLSSAQLHQQGMSYSGTSTPHLMQLPTTASSSSPGTPSAYGTARRSRSNLMRALASPGATQASEVFCKLQRSDVQRLRRRGSLLPPGTECPGLAGRLAYDAYRDAVRRGLVKEEEECSYYLSHHRYTSLPTPAASTSGGGERGGQTSSTTPISQHSQILSELLPSPPALRRSHSPLVSLSHPLCVVSLADCRAKSPTHPKKTQQRALGHGAYNNTKTSPYKDASAAASKVNSLESGGVDDGFDLRSRRSSEMSESWTGPRFLYHIPRCCDDPYHRDEEALEMISVTTTSSCAFGAGLDGLSWQEWMPSSPIEAGEEVLRNMAASDAATLAMPSSSSSKHGAPSNAAMAGGNLNGSIARMHGNFNWSASSILPPNSFVGTGNGGGVLVPTPTNAGSVGAVTAEAAAIVPLMPLGIAAPRNADDIASTGTSTSHDGPPTSPFAQHCTQTGASSGGAGADRAGAATATAASSTKRPFIAGWIVSKLQKHMEKKREKKQKKQQEREAAAVAAVLGSGACACGSSPPAHGEEYSIFLTDPALNRTKTGALYSRSNASARSDFSDVSSPCGSNSSPQLHRLAYLAAAYQTELVICEQKRRESRANRRGISELVERSRTRMTPEAAAVGYYYGTQGGGETGIGKHDHNHNLPRLQQHKENDASYPRLTSPRSPKQAAKLAPTAAPGADNGVGRNASSSSRRNSRNISSSSIASTRTRHRRSGAMYSSGSSSLCLQAVVSVASPVPTGDASAHTPSDSPPVARTTANRRHHAPDHEGEEDVEATAAAVVLEWAKTENRSRRLLPTEPISTAEQHMSTLKERRQSKPPHTHGGTAEKAEAEQVRAALETVRTKQKAIESWIRSVWIQR